MKITFEALAFCLAVLSHCSIHPVIATEDPTLTLAVFVSAINTTGSFTGGKDVGRPFVEAVGLAVELVNNDTTLMPGYTLGYSITDSQCESGPSVRGFIDQIETEPRRIMIIGADCSTSSEPIAELAPFWNLVQISPVSSSPVLSNNVTYSTFLRMVSSDVAAADGVVNLMVNFNWTRVAVLSQQENIFTSTSDELRQALLQANITVDPREFTFNSNDDPTNVVTRLENSPTRIIFLNVYPSYSLEILCQAHQRGMTHRNGYLWLLHAWYPNEWWLDEPAERTTYDPVLCERETLEEMIEYAILINHYSSVEGADRDEPTNSTLTRNKFDSLIQERLVGAEDRSLASQAQFYFDSVWAAALSLHSAIIGGYNLSSFTYEPDDNVSLVISNVLFNTTKKLQFTGMSGPVQFDEVGDRYPSLRYFQYTRNVNSTIVRSHIGTEFDFIPIQAIFPFGVPEDEVFVYIHVALFAVYTVLACAGIVFAFVCLIFNIYFKDRKIVKLSSPYLNVLIVCGVVFFYIDVILFGIDEGLASRSTVDALCMTRLWIASISYSLVFGTIFAKTWRVYYVFYSSNRHKRSKKRLIQDWVLFLMVGGLVIIDVVFMIFVTAFPGSRLSLENVELPSNSQQLPSVVGLCRADDRFIWLSILFVYKGMLLIVGVFLAFETRNVKIRHLNDSRLIGMSVYGIVVLSIALAAVGILLETNVDAFYAVVGLMVMLGNTSLLCLIFIPKFYGLWKDPEGLKVMGGGDTTTVNGIGSPDSKQTIMQLNQEIQKLRQELSQLQSSNNTLTSPLSSSKDTFKMDADISESRVTQNGDHKKSRDSIILAEVTVNFKELEPSTP